MSSIQIKLTDDNKKPALSTGFIGEEELAHGLTNAF